MIWEEWLEIKEYWENIWWDSLTWEEQLTICYLDIYKKSKKLGLKYSTIKKFLLKPPNIEPKNYCSLCGVEINLFIGIIGLDYKFCHECNEFEENIIEQIKKDNWDKIIEYKDNLRNKQ